MSGRYEKRGSVTSIGPALLMEATATAGCGSQAGPIVIRFPNTQSRVRSVKLHDLHHVLTGYDTSWSGEAEIAAWEIASGCATHYAAWVLNLGAFAIGLLIDLRGVYAAFIRGRHTANLYRDEFADGLLARTVGDIRSELGLDSVRRRITWADRLAFVGWAAAAKLSALAPIALVLACILAVACRA